MVNLSADRSLGNLFHALRDPVRRALVARLRLGDAAIAVLAADHDISLPAVSRHVKILERAGLVSRRRAGREYRLHLRSERLHEASAWIQAMTPPEPAINARGPENLPVRLGDTFRPALGRRRMN